MCWPTTSATRGRAMMGFIRQRDWMYVAITAIVLTLLLYSLLTA